MRHFQRVNLSTKLKEYAISSFIVPEIAETESVAFLRIKIEDEDLKDIKLITCCFVSYVNFDSEGTGENGFFVDAIYQDIQLSMSFQIISLVQLNGVPQLALLSSVEGVDILAFDSVFVDFDSNELVVGFKMNIVDLTVGKVNILLRVLDKALIASDGEYDEKKIVVNVSDSIRVKHKKKEVPKINVVEYKNSDMQYDSSDVILFLEEMIPKELSPTLCMLLLQHYPDYVADINLINTLTIIIEEFGFDDLEDIQSCFIKTINILQVISPDSDALLNSFRRSDGKTFLHITCLVGYTALVKNITENFYLDIDVQDGDGNTSLHYSNKKGFKNITEILLANNANKNIPNKEDKTSYDIAVQYNRRAILKLMDSPNDVEMLTIPRSNKITRSPKVMKRSSSTTYLPSHTHYSKTDIIPVFEEDSSSSTSSLDSDMSIEEMLLSVLSKEEFDKNNQLIQSFADSIEENSRSSWSHSIYLNTQFPFFLSEHIGAPCLNDIVNQTVSSSSLFLFKKKMDETEDFEVYCASYRDNPKNHVTIKKYSLSSINTSLLSFELHIMKNFSHPNIITYHDAFIQDKWILAIYEHLHLGKLSQILVSSEYSPFTEKEAIYVIFNILKALDYLHSLKFIHWNINPTNIFVGVKGEVKLANFDRAQYLELVQQKVPSHMRSVVLGNDVIDEKIDIWSVGIMCIEILEGEVKIPAPNLISAQGLFFKSLENRSPSLLDFTGNCLQRNRNLRPSAAELLNHKIFNLGCSKEEFLRFVHTVKKIEELNSSKFSSSSEKYY